MGLDFSRSQVKKKFPIPEKQISEWENFGKLNIIHRNKIPWHWKVETVCKSMGIGRCLQSNSFPSQYQQVFMSAHVAKLVPMNADEWQSLDTAVT